MDHRLFGTAHLVRRQVLVSCFPFLGWWGPWEAGGLWWVVSGTLLGPEGSDASSVAFSSGLTCCLYRVSPACWGVAAGACGGVPPVC